MTERQWDTQDVVIRGNAACLDIWYPNQRDVKFVEIGLVCVRAADHIRISYDYARDGWKVEQASRFSWNVDDEDCDPDWQEVAFIKSWGRQETPEQESARLGYDEGYKE